MSKTRNAPHEPAGETATRPDRIALLVAGMHRSGTSALTRVLNLLGAALPEHLMQPAEEDNEAGFWESRPLADLHDAMLSEAGSRWDDWRAFDAERRLGAARYAHYRREIRRLVREEFGEAPLLVLKEPRICRFVPLYQEILSGIGLEARFVLPVRNPLAVVGSLARRQEMTPGFAGLLWLRHVLDADAETRASPRVVVPYDRLLEDWRGVVDRIATKLGLEWPRTPDVAAEQVESFLHRDLRHHRPTLEDLDDDPTIARWVRDTYHALLELAESDMESPAALDVLSRTRREFENVAEVFGDATFPELAVRERRLIASREEATSRLAAREEQIARLGREHDARVAALEQSLAASEERATVERHAALQSEARLAELRERFRDLQTLSVEQGAEVARLQEEVATRHTESHRLAEALASTRRELEIRNAEVDTIYRSKSWRATAPLRAARRGLRSLAHPRVRAAPAVYRFWRGLPVRRETRIRIKSAVFLTFPALFRHTRVYRNWRVYEYAPRAVRSRGRDASLPGVARGPSVALVAHAFYPEVFDEILASIRRAPEIRKLYVTTPVEQADRVRHALEVSGRPYALETVPNRGRDVLPFLRLIPRVRDDGYEVLVKVHTKRSPHRVFGDQWRRDMVSALLEPRAVARAVAAFASDPDLGILGPAAHYVEPGRQEEPGTRRLAEIAERLGVDRERLHDLGFFAGTMFYARTAAVEPLVSLGLTDASFEAEQGQVDGTLAHVLERAMSLGALASGHKVAVMRRRSITTVTEPSKSRQGAGSEPDPLDPTGLAFAATEHPEISVIVPVHNQLHFTLGCLRSLARQDCSWPFEVLVMDDASTDRTRDVVASLPGVRYFRNETALGFVGNCNRGAHEARGEYLVFLNNDTECEPSWLARLRATYDEHEDVGVVGSKLIFADGRLQEAGGILWEDGTGWNWGRDQDPRHPRFNFARDVDYVSGSSFMIPRRLFLDTGGFDEDFSPAYYEDAGKCFDARRAGMRVLYQPQSIVTHFEGVSYGTDTSSGMKRYQAVNRATFVDKYRHDLAGYLPNGAEPDIASDRRPGGHVLIVDAVTPTPDRDAGSIVMFNLIRILIRLGYRVHFIPQTNFAHVGEYTATLQRMGVECLYAPYYRSVREFLMERGDRFDCVVLSRLPVAAASIADVRRHAPSARVIFYTIDLHFLREERQAQLSGDPEDLAAARSTRREELDLVARSELTIVLSEVERDILRDLGYENIAVLPLLWEVQERGPRGFEDRRGVVFVGGYRHPPNVDAAHWLVETIWPEVRRLCADQGLSPIPLSLVGSDMPDAVQGLASQDVEVLGYVEDLEDLFDRIRISVVPLRFGAGLKGKVATSLGYGVPTVGTEMAFEGMPAEGLEEVAVQADDPVGLAREIVALHGDRDRWERISQAGQAFVARHFAADALEPRVREILASADGLARGSAPASTAS